MECESMSERVDRNYSSEKFSFWWATSKPGKRAMYWVMILCGLIMLIFGYYNTPVEYGVGKFMGRQFTAPLLQHWDDKIIIALKSYVFIGLTTCYFTINFGRLFYHISTQSESHQIKISKRLEEDELESLRRRSEINKLKAELGESDNESSTNVGQSTIPTARKIYNDE